MGSGVLIFSSSVDIKPFMHGGTGSESFSLLQPDCYPEKLECGTLNLPAIVALYEGVMHVKNHIEFTASQLTKMTEYLVNSLNKIDGVTVYSKPNKSGIVAFKLANLSSEECAERLSIEYDIAVRAGFHCAPLMHKFLNTEEDGLIRASLAPQNTFKEITLFLRAINQLILGGL